MPKQLPRLPNCLNCGHPTGDNFCPKCGQENEDQRAALSPLISDLLSDIANWDSKLLRTLRMLIHPGRLTVEYNAGRRAHYVSPLKLYVVASLLFFLVVSRDVGKIDPGSTNVIKLDTSPKTPGLKLTTKKTSGLGVQADPEDLPKSIEQYDANQKALGPKQRDSRITQQFKRQLIRAINNPKDFVRGIVDTVPKLMLVLLPVFALLLKIIYWRSKRFYISHLIFALHGHAFAMLVYIIPQLFPNGWVIFGTFCASFVYLFKSMRVVYEQSFWKTTVKFVLLSGLYVICLSWTLSMAVALAFVLM